MKKINVEIKCKQVVEYNQLVEMNEDDFYALQELNGDDINEDRDFVEYRIVEKYIDHSDICSSENQYLSVEVFKEQD